MLKWVFIFFLAVILILIIFYNVVNWSEDKALFFPSKKRVWKPTTNYKSIFLNVNDRRDVCYSSKDRRKGHDYISAWHFDNFKNAKTICFSHGNTHNITQRKYIIDICRKFKMNLLVYDYRGFGRSSSFPHKLFLREDGETAFEYLTKYCRIPNKDIILWTESLGAISGVWTASRNKCGGLIIFSGFSSLDDAISYRFKGDKQTGVKFLTNLLSYKMDMIPVKEYLQDVNCPVVVVHSRKDEMIPYACSWINYNSIPHKNKLHVKISGGHSSPIMKTKQLREIFQFCDLPDENLSSHSISHILKDLTTFAERHNNFID